MKEGLNYAEIGRRLGITGERVRQIANPKPKPKSQVEPEKPEHPPMVLLTVSDVARIFSVHVNTVIRWANKETLKPYRIGKRRDRRFLKEDVERLRSERNKSKGER